MVEISPSNGRIVLNSFPKSLLVRTELPELLKKIKEPIEICDDSICLIYDIASEKLLNIKKDSY
jgi:hypothetical protein